MKKLTINSQIKTNNMKISRVTVSKQTTLLFEYTDSENHYSFLVPVGDGNDDKLIVITQSRDGNIQTELKEIKEALDALPMPIAEAVNKMQDYEGDFTFSLQDFNMPTDNGDKSSDEDKDDCQCPNCIKRRKIEAALAGAMPGDANLEAKLKSANAVHDLIDFFSKLSKDKPQA